VNVRVGSYSAALVLDILFTLVQVPRERFFPTSTHINENV